MDCEEGRTARARFGSTQAGGGWRFPGFGVGPLDTVLEKIETGKSEG